MIQVDLAYKKLFDYLLRDVLITESENLSEFDAVIARDEATEGIVILNQSGSLTKRRYSLSGGSVGLFEGKKIGRKKNLEILEKEIKDTEGVASDWQKELGQGRSDINFLKSNEQKATIQKAQNELNQTRQQKVFLQTRIDNFSTFINEADVKKQRAKEQIATLIQTIEKVDVQLIERKFAVSVEGKTRIISSISEQD